ncbi:MAG: glycosyltransferase, partial [Thermoleophilia bacterium]|nr:glycosyltransferase [Thermoleophilia bacterium]
AVLANSGHEPFGLVGLEVMAAGGIAFVGSTGEDYAVPFLNSVVLDTEDPAEIDIALHFLRTHPEVAQRLRSDAQETARSFTWENVIVDTLLGKLEYVSLRQLVTPPQQSTPTEGCTAPGPAADDAPRTADVAAGDASGGDAPSANTVESQAYGGESVSRKLAVKPRKTAE